MEQLISARSTRRVKPNRHALSRNLLRRLLQDGVAPLTPAKQTTTYPDTATRWVTTFNSVLANSPPRTDSFGDLVTAHPDLSGFDTAGVGSTVDGVVTDTIILTHRNFTTPKKDISGDEVPVDEDDEYSGNDSQYDEIDAWPV
jgi:hypothetical protein